MPLWVFVFMPYSVFYEVIHICSRNHGMKYILNFNTVFSFMRTRRTRLGKYESLSWKDKPKWQSVKLPEPSREDWMGELRKQYVPQGAVLNSLFSWPEGEEGFDWNPVWSWAILLEPFSAIPPLHTHGESSCQPYLTAQLRKTEGISWPDGVEKCYKEQFT